MRRRALLLMAIMAAALVVASGVALAATINCEVGRVCNGTERGDTLNGTRRADTIQGLGGDDQIRGYEGGDTLKGGDGADIVRGREGADEIYGGSAPEGTINVLSGGYGNDTIEGGDGRDTLDGNKGDDTLKGKIGDDTLLGRGGLDDLYDDHGRSNELYGFQGNDILGVKVSPLKRADNRLVGGDGDDRLVVRLNMGLEWWPGDPTYSTATVYGDYEYGNHNPQDEQKAATGNDIIRKKPYFDTLQTVTVHAGPGDDDIRVRDGTPNDSVDCGPGTDTVYYDEIWHSSSGTPAVRMGTDDVSSNCENKQKTLRFV